MAVKMRHDEPEEERAEEKLLPQNTEAEAGVLGSLLIDPDAIVEVVDFLSAGDFFREANRVVYETICDLFDRGIPSDLITLSDELGRRGRLEDIGGLSYISSLANQVPTSSNIEHYARIVERTAVLRRLIQAAGQVAAVAYNEPDVQVALDQTERLVAAVRESHKTPNSAVDAQEASDLMNEDIAPPKWAVPNLFGEGLTLMGGKPKQGKSTLTLQVLMAVAHGGIALGKIRCERGEALYLALEDNRRRMQRRLHAMLGFGDRSAPRGLYLRYDWPKLDEGGIDMLDQWMKQHPKTRIIAIDTYKKVKPRGDPKARNVTLYDADYEALLPLQTWANRAGVSVVVIAHTRKSSAESAIDEISGSTGLTGVADNIVVMRKNGELTELHRVGRDYVDDDVWGLRGDAQTLLWTIEGPWQSASRTADRQAIIDALQKVGLPGVGSASLAAMLRREPAQIRTTLSKMEDGGDPELGHNRAEKLYFYRGSKPLRERETRETEETLETVETMETSPHKTDVVSVVSTDPIGMETDPNADVADSEASNVSLFPLFPRADARAKADGVTCPARQDPGPHEFVRKNRRALVRVCKFCDAIETEV